MQYTQEITLELNSNTAYTTVGAKQGDNNSRVISVHITQNGEDYDLSGQGVSSAYFRFRKPDGKAIINTATVDYENNVIKLVFTAQTLAASGRGYADVTLLSGSTILSTVSFIIIIMSSPQVANQAVSSDEFGYLNRVVEDATHTIYNAEAWAAGTRGGQEVFGEDHFEISKQSEIINLVSVDESIFMSHVGEKHGTERIFTFSYNDDGTWNLILQTIEGITTTESSPEVVSNINDYGITYSLFMGADTPNKGDKIIVTVAESDDAFENNAKYYAEQAATSHQAIEDLTVDVHTIDESAEAYVIKDSSSYPVNISFYLPQGRTGNVNFMTFEIHPEDGQLWMYRPLDIPDQIQFDICEDIESPDNGKLRVIIDTEVANNG